MGLTSMAVTAIASATKYYIKESSRVEYFPIEAKKQLELAYLYLDNAETENQIRSALVHMENSALKIFDSGFDSVVANGTTKAIKYNTLCYEISLLHKKLNDAYELVKYWAFKNEFSLKNTDGDYRLHYKDLLSETDYITYIDKFVAVRIDNSEPEWDPYVGLWSDWP